ncbi:VWA domain-containing protein [Streptomyces sp. NPDC019443]|uniref:vWA domain-containing protein n=1 Tax=Streptomyces sp. NPDC019443 TaxID=3365061 RepID=UPI0037B07B2A
MAETLGQLLPVYVLADESYSMASQVNDLNAGMKSLHMALLGEPMAAAKVRFSVLGFSNTVTEHLILADLRGESELPRLSAGGGTSYEAAFSALLQRVPNDVSSLKSQGYRVHRPAVFFLSDGQPNPNENWTEVHRRLTDRNVTSAAPNVIAFGIGDAEAETILNVATQAEFAFISLPGSQLGDSIAKFFTALTKSVVESGNAMASGQAELVVEKPEGFRLAIDEV